MIQIDNAIFDRYKRAEIVQVFGISVPCYQDVTIGEYEAIARAQEIERKDPTDSANILASRKEIAVGLIQSRIDPTFPPDGLDGDSLDVFVSGQREIIPITKRLIDECYSFVIREFAASNREYKEESDEPTEGATEKKPRSRSQKSAGL